MRSMDEGSGGKRPRRSPRGGAPRSLAGALESLRADVGPRTLLAAAQEAWPEAAGSLAAAQGEPVSEREGVVTIACRSATWAQELDLMQADLLPRLREAMASAELADALVALRFTADAARRDPA